MIALLLALGSSLAHGCADFLGGLGARKAHVLRTVMIAAPASRVVELLLWPLLGASFSTGALGWGAASGAAHPSGTALLLARGVLAERIHRDQLVGLGTAAIAVSLLALT
ncbi:hypothetical protein OHA64_03775 [Streptomyces sp. NBC_00076]